MKRYKQLKSLLLHKNVNSIVDTIWVRWDHRTYTNGKGFFLPKEWMIDPFFELIEEPECCDGHYWTECDKKKPFIVGDVVNIEGNPFEVIDIKGERFSKQYLFLDLNNI